IQRFKVLDSLSGMQLPQQPCCLLEFAVVEVGAQGARNSREVYLFWRNHDVRPNGSFVAGIQACQQILTAGAPREYREINQSVFACRFLRR
ncbi:hypothetical protein BZG24_28900, partial [Escherichia coli]|nr:hypothetical protein [Escherichia coli]